ncbi:hypothetical protein NXS19_009228 [Fusarium pseudograminearum]|nr:hypothetical protein NXS19_009228 [Fusarium pseudograminearum]
MQRPVPGPKPSGGLGRAVLLLLLALFSVTSFITFVLASVSACKYPTTLSHFIKTMRDHPSTKAPIY